MPLLPAGAPPWATVLYWAILASGLALGGLLYLGMRLYSGISKLRVSNHQIVNTAAAAKLQTELTAKRQERLLGALNGEFDQRLQRSIREVLADPTTGQMFVAAFRLATRMEVEQIAAQAAQIAVGEHEHREHGGQRWGRRRGDTSDEQ